MPLIIGAFRDAVRSKGAGLGGNLANLLNRANFESGSSRKNSKWSSTDTVSNRSSLEVEDEENGIRNIKKRSHVTGGAGQSPKSIAKERSRVAYVEPPSPPAPPLGGLYEVATNNVQTKMRNTLQLSHRTATCPDDKSVNCSVYVTKSSRPLDRYVLFIGGADGSPAGIWSAKLCTRSGHEGGGIFNGSLGSMLPYLAEARREKYGVLVFDDIFKGHVHSDGSIDIEQAVQRFMLVWRQFVTTSSASHVFITTYEEGGLLLVECLRKHFDEMQRLISGITFIQSPHQIAKQDSYALRKLLAQWSIAYFARHSPLLSRLYNLEDDVGSVCFCMGTKEPDVEGLRNIVGSVFASYKARWSGFRHKSCSDGMEKCCYICQKGFNMRRWRRHCRTCNNACCEKCSSLDVVDSEGYVRFCLTCRALPSLLQRSRPRPIRTGEKLSIYGERPENGKLSLLDFELIDTLGSGACGKVLLVQKKAGVDAGKLFAMKVLKKSWVINKDLVKQTMAERRILQEANHPYIVQLQYAFQNHDRLYLVMDFFSGGSLRQALHRRERFSIRRSQIYLAQICLAISHLHSLDIIYRDLKLENIVISAEGNVACTDFGLSKEDVDDNDRTKSFVGTCAYLAPELVRKESYGKAVDWWAFGILAYELIEGDSPFQHPVPSLLFEKIMREEPEFGSRFPDEAADFISRLLEKDPRQRLGCGEHGVDEIKQHYFFDGIDWDALIAKQAKIPPPPHRIKDVTDESSLSRAIVKTRESREEIMPHSPIALPASPTEPMHFERFSYMGNDWHPNMANLHADDDDEGDTIPSDDSDENESTSNMTEARLRTKKLQQYRYPTSKVRQPQHRHNVFDDVTESVTSSESPTQSDDGSTPRSRDSSKNTARRTPDYERTSDGIYAEQETPLSYTI